jgi:hypothetical protein
VHERVEGVARGVADLLFLEAEGVEKRPPFGRRDGRIRRLRGEVQPDEGTLPGRFEGAASALEADRPPGSRARRDRLRARG